MLLSGVRSCLLLLVLVGCEGNSSLSTKTGLDVVFSDVTEEAGMGAFRHTNGSFGQAWAPEIVGAGAGFLDYNDDGWLDILLVGGGAFQGQSSNGLPALWLYQNKGNGTFALASQEAGLDKVQAYGLGLAIADYDNDGDEDFFLTTLYKNMLFRNDAGVFTEVGEEAQLANEDVWSTSTLFFDADRDGNLDLFVGNYVDWSPEKDIYCAYNNKKVYCTPQEYTGKSSRYYHNNGDGTFTDLTVEAGLLGGIDPSRDKVLGVAEADFNDDGWVDLLIANDTERDLLYMNQGDGTFEETGIRSGIAFDQHGRPRAGMGIDIGVVDSSGYPSVFVGNFSEETVGVYQYTGDDLFMDRANISRIGHSSMTTLTFGLFLFDVDLDTDLDLFAANGHVQTHIEYVVEGVTFRQRPQLYLNRGNGLFDEFVAEDGPLTQMMVARGAAFGDIDRDGDLDVLVTENNGPAHLWRNDQQGGRYLRVGVEGVQSNRSGLGARIEVELDGLRMERRIRTGSSYLSQSELVAVFGLGENTEVDSVVVYWPSGVVDRFGTVAGNQEIRIIEGAESFERISIQKREGR